MTRPAEQEERFADWVDGRMSARERQRFEAELRVNDELRRRAEEYRRTVELVRRALAEPEESVDLTERVMAALPRKRAAGSRLLRGRFGPLVGSAAAAAALIGVFLVLQSWPSEPAPGDDTTTIAHREVMDRDARSFESDADAADDEDARVGFASKTGAPLTRSEPAGEAGVAQRPAPDPQLGQKQGRSTTDALNRRDLQMVLEELGKAEDEALLEQERALREQVQRLQTAQAEVEPNATEQRSRQRNAEPTADTPPPAAQRGLVAGRGAGRTGEEKSGEERLETKAEQRKAAKAPAAPGEAEATEEQSPPQIRVRSLDEAPPSDPEAGAQVDARPQGRLAYGLPIERVIPVVTVQLDPDQRPGFAGGRRERAADDFFMGADQRDARNGQVVGGWSAFFDGNAIAVQQPVNEAPEATDLEQQVAAFRVDAGESFLLQEVPQQWLSFERSTADREAEMRSGLPAQVQAPQQVRSYFVEGTTADVREMLASLYRWAREENRADLGIGQVAEAEVAQALSALQEQTVARQADLDSPVALDRAQEVKGGGQREAPGRETAEPGPAGPSTPGPERAQAPDPEAMVRRILIVFQEQRPPK